MNLNEFKILKESDDAYEIGHPNGKKLSIKKSGINEKGHALIQKLRGQNNYADAGEVAAVEPEVPVADIPSYLQPNPVVDNPLPSGGNPVMTGELQPGSGGGQAPMPATPEGMLAQKAGGIEGALREQQKFNTMAGQAEAGQGAQEAKAINEVQRKIDQMPTQQDIINQNKAKDDALYQSFANKTLDPERFLKNQGTASKISTGIGLILGGIGSGLTGQPNAALGLLKDHIDRDIEAQRNDQSKGMNLWKMNREALGNDLAANLATQNQMYTGLKYKIMQAGAQAASPIALARVGSANAMIDQQIAQNRMQQSLIQVGMNGSGPNGASGNGPQDPSILIPQLIREPGEQAAAIKEVKQAMDNKKSYQAIMDAFDKAAEDTRPLTGGMKAIPNAIPGYTPASIKALDAEMGPTFNNIEGTVRQAAMDNMHNNIHPQFGDSAATVATKRAALDNYMHSAMAAPTTKAHGIDLSKFAATNIDAPDKNAYYDWAMKNKNSSDPEVATKAQRTLKALGGNR